MTTCDSCGDLARPSDPRNATLKMRCPDGKADLSVVVELLHGDSHLCGKCWQSVKDKGATVALVPSTAMRQTEN